MPVKGQATPQAKSPLQAHEFELKPAGPREVEIQITHCGVCHSDIHLIDNDWGISKYPLIPGHEIIGTVAAKGKEVSHLKVGDRVGVGWLAGTCLECEWCLRGEETSCAKQIATCVGRPGGFAERTVAHGQWAFKIPEALDSEGTAPLLCGGITVYTPLVENADSSSRVGVVGIGGLGHMAIKFARAMGCEVTAFSTSPDKAAEARALGAQHFVLSRDPTQMKQAAESLDVLVSAVTADLDWEAWLRVLRPTGTLVFVGASPGPINIRPFSLMAGRKSIRGSVTGGRLRIQEMLAFAARHGIRAQTESVPLNEANAAVEKVRSNRARYRMVLRTSA
jgi:uncharacterized zinc-type alcohol dehydrogenase-like protein